MPERAGPDLQEILDWMEVTNSVLVLSCLETVFCSLIYNFPRTYRGHGPRDFRVQLNGFKVQPC